MIYELPGEQFGLAEPLFGQARFDATLIEAVLEGKQQGRIFVDDARRPAAGLLCHPYDYFVVGDPATRTLRSFMVDAPREAQVFQHLYGYVPLDEAWVRVLVADHGGDLEVIPRRSYTFDTTHSPAIADRLRTIPAGLALVAIDALLAERIDAELHEHIHLLWGSYDRFAADGFGFCGLLDGALACVCYATAVSDHSANISVATALSYRRRGLATLTCAAFVRECLARGLVVTWDSDAANEASIATARTLGFGAETPFSELGLPGRRKPDGSQDRWTSRPWHADPSITEWLRRPGLDASSSHSPDPEA